MLSQISEDGGNNFEEHTWEGQGDENNSEEESVDNDNGRTAPPDSAVLTFDDLKPDMKKRKSQLELLGIPKPEKRELTEDEQKNADELANEFGSFLTPEKAVDPWKGLDTENSF